MWTPRCGHRHRPESGRTEGGGPRRPRKKLFVFLREIRGELFDDAFQEELLEMYRQTGAGKPPCHRRCWRWRRCCKPIPGSAIRGRWN